MRKIYLVILFFITLFLSGMIYFIVTIDNSFAKKEKVMIQRKEKTDISATFDFYLNKAQKKSEEA